MKLAVFAAWMMAVAALSAEHGHHGVSAFSRAPYVQLATHESIFVVWRLEAKAEPVVRFGSSPEKLDGEVRGARVITRYATTNKMKLAPGVFRLHSAPEGTYQYEAQITGLRPDTPYYYG